MSKPLCRFEQVRPGVVRCKTCEHTMETESPPERCFRQCTPRGLGDTIAKLTHATGIAQAVEVISHVVSVPCGCKERQQWLNKVVPYRQEQDN